MHHNWISENSQRNYINTWRVILTYLAIGIYTNTNKINHLFIFMQISCTWILCQPVRNEGCSHIGHTFTCNSRERNLYDYTNIGQIDFLNMVNVFLAVFILVCFQDFVGKCSAVLPECGDVCVFMYTVYSLELSYMYSLIRPTEKCWENSRYFILAKVLCLNVSSRCQFQPLLSKYAFVGVYKWLFQKYTFQYYFSFWSSRQSILHWV